VKSSLRTFVDWLVYMTARCTLAFLQALPWDTARAAARLLGDLSYVLDRPQRKARALSNLLKSFPALETREARRILRGVYRHLSESILDALNVARFARHWDSQDLFQMVGWERLEKVHRTTGVLFVTGHFGHWEMLGAALPLFGYPLWTVGRSRRNRFFDSYIQWLREATGQRVLPKHRALARVMRLVRRGENVGFVIDQDVRRQGIFVDFFGRLASTTPSVAKISIRTGCPIAFIYAQRIPRQNRFKVELKDIVIPRPECDTSAEVHRITQRLTSDLEEVVRQAPHQWLWLHRRWKAYQDRLRRTRF